MAGALAALALATQDPAQGRAIIAGESAVFSPAKGLWDANTHRASIVFLTAPLSAEAEARARQAGSWPADVTGPAVFVEVTYAASSSVGLASEVTSCHVRFRGFKTPLELKGGRKECHLVSTGGLLRTGGALSGLLEGTGAGYSFRLPLAVAFLEVPSTTTAERPAAAPAMPAPAAARPERYEHRVLVPTTSRDTEREVEGSLERHVNALGALGYELTAMVGGDATVIDRLLARRPAVPGLVDHGGLTFAIMARPVGQRVVAREYRLLHTRTGLGVDRIVAPLGAAGYHMTVTAFDGEVVHQAFERIEGAPAVEFRVFRNRGRSSWFDLLREDADAKARLRRVVPIALDAAVVELGPAQPAPGDLEWLRVRSGNFESLESSVRELARNGYRVELVRPRANEIDVLVVKPASAAAAPADYELDEGPWGSPCSRGRLVGAAVQPDGDVACVAERGGTAPVTNRGLDLTLREQSSAGGQVLFRGPDCDIRARLGSTRPAAPRVALAAQFERELDQAVAPGFRVVHALAARDANGQMRIVAFTSDAPSPTPAGPAATAEEGPPLVPDLDGVGDDLRRQREARLNASLARDGRFTGAPLWIELSNGRIARLLGCVPRTLDRELADSAARGLLIREGLGDYRFESRVVVDR